MRARGVKRTLLAVLSAAASLAPPSWATAQIPVTDVATATRNAATAAVKELLLRLQEQQHSELRRMAHRLSNFTSLDKYAAAEAPLWRIHDFEDADAVLFSRIYHAALNYGDAAGNAYQQVARTRIPVPIEPLYALPAGSRDSITRMLATLDAADSTLIAGTHQTGQLRYNGRREMLAIAALERHVIDPSQTQSMTAVADKISGAVLIGARQRQARLQLLIASLEQLLLENKRARDSDAVSMNMQLGQLQHAVTLNAGLIAGTGDALRKWRQP